MYLFLYFSSNCVYCFVLECFDGSEVTTREGNEEIKEV